MNEQLGAACGELSSALSVISSQLSSDQREDIQTIGTPPYYDLYQAHHLYPGFCYHQELCILIAIATLYAYSYDSQCRDSQTCSFLV